jgi:hypothetical protein
LTVSRGPGYIERAIAVCIAECTKKMVSDTEYERLSGGKKKRKTVLVRPWTVYHACGFCPCPIPNNWRPSESQHKAVARAMRSFVRKFPQYAVLGRRSGTLCLYEAADPLSEMWARLCSQRQMHVAMVDAQMALEHKQARRNERFVISQKKSKLSYGTRGGRLSARPPRPWRPDL